MCVSLGGEMSWQARVRRRQEGRRLKFFALLALLFLAWFAGVALFWLVHVITLGPPSVQRLMAVYLGVGAALLAAFAKWGPTLPFRGRAPEEAAARAFFARESVRSDDNKFEPGLEP